MEDFLRNEEGDIKNLLNRFKKKNFAGDTGQAIKNSSYQLTQNIIAKVGSLVFTILLARIMMPELFGLYSLAISTIVLFGAFSDLGIGSAVITYISKKISKKEEAKGYFKKLLHWKIILLSLVSVVLAGSSYFIANYYYNKPIFLALLAGIIYLFVNGLLSFLENSFKADNKFKNPMVKEIIFQSMRLVLVPLFVFFILKTQISNSWITALTFLVLSGCYLAGAVYLIVKARKKLSFINSKSKNLNSNEKKELKKFLLPLSATVLSGVFFGNIDTIMLGHFVSSNFISYYSAAFNLIASASGIIGFAALALFPVFSRLEGKKLERMFIKSRNSVFLISLASAIFTYFIARIVVLIAYGQNYIEAVPILEYFSILILITPLIGLYNNYFISREKTMTIAWLLIGSTLLNIILNYFFITYGLQFNQMYAVLGACFATIISNIAYVVGFYILRRRMK